MKTIMLTLEDKSVSGPKLTSITVEHLDLAKGLKNIFEMYWSSSVTLEEYKNSIGS